MWPDNSYAPPVGSFVRPVPLPAVDPDALPALTIAVNCEWLPYIRGALQQLLLQATWSTGNPASLLLAQQRAATLIAMFTECAGSPAFSCPYDFSAPTATDQGWAFVDDSPCQPTAQGNFDRGTGWVSTFSENCGGNTTLRGIDIHQHYLAAITVDRVRMTYNLTQGFYSVVGDQTGIIISLGGGTVATSLVPSQNLPNGLNQTFEINGPHTIDDVRLVIRCGAGTATQDPGGVAEITRYDYNIPGGHCG